MDCRGARVEAGKTAEMLLYLSQWDVMTAWTRVVVVVVVEMERRIPQMPPALLKPIFSLNPVTRVCSRICSTCELVHSAGLCWSLLFQEAFSRQCWSSKIFQVLCLPSALSILTPDSSQWLGFSLVHFWSCLHLSCCLAFSLWKVNALLAFAEWYQQGSFGNYICKWLLMPIALSLFSKLNTGCLNLSSRSCSIKTYVPIFL